MIKAVLFDADGVLFEATELHRVSLNQALAKYGYTITDEEHFSFYNGLPTKVKLEQLTKDKGLPKCLHEEIEQLKQDITLEEIPKIIVPNQQIIQALQFLKDKGIICGICSNAREKSVYRMATAGDIAHFFKIILGNECVANNKPAPDIYLYGAKLLEIPISNCAIVEDSPNGLKAAYAANPGVVLKVRNPGDVKIDLFKDVV